MEPRVRLSKDGSSIDFTQSDSLPTSMKKFRQSPEIEGFYRFIYENDLQKEAFEILERIIEARKAKREQGGAKAAKAPVAPSKAASPKAEPVKVAKAAKVSSKPPLQKAAKPVAPVSKTKPIKKK